MPSLVKLCLSCFVCLLAVLITQVDSRRKHRIISGNDPVDNINLEEAVSDFVRLWQSRHRYKQNIDYQFSLRSEPYSDVFAQRSRGLSSRPLDDERQRQSSRPSSLQTEHRLSNLERENIDLMGALTDEDMDIPLVPPELIGERVETEFVNGFQPDVEVPAPVSRECPVCNVSRETDKQLRIAMIQHQILKRLGLKEPPPFNVSQVDLNSLMPLRNLFVPPFGLYNENGGGALYDEYQPADDDDNTATVIKLVSFGERLPPEKAHNRSVSDQVCYFSFKNDNRKARVNRAILWVYLRPAKMTRGNSSHLDIYRLGPPMYPQGPLTGQTVHTRKIHPSAVGGWYSFDMKNVVRGWISNPDDMYGLQIEAQDDEGNDLPVIMPKSQQEMSYKPIIELRFTDIRTRQKRRIEEHCDESQNITRCCLYPLTVDFAQMGWTFILNPRTYKANYCSGDCPNVYKQNFQHTHVVQQAYAAKKPCCAPKNMKAVSFLYYYSNGNIVYGKVPDMSVESCTCV